MSVKTYRKDPGAIRQYGHRWLEGVDDPITASDWTAPAGITIDSESFTTVLALVQVSGGTLGEDYELINHVTFTSGQEDERSIIVQVRNVEASLDYCSTDEVRAIGTQLTENALPGPTLEALIERASRFFDLECGVEPGYFAPNASAASARVFYGDGTNYLKLDPFVPSPAPTLIVPDGYTAPEFIVRDGYLILSSSGVSAPGLYWTSRWWIGVPIIVTAKWGYSATPADVKMSVIELVINVYRETDPAFIKLINIEGQPLREKCPPRVLEAARKYRLKTAKAVFV